MACATSIPRTARPAKNPARKFISDRRDGLRQKVANLTRDRGQFRVLDRLHRRHRVDRADHTPPSTSRRMAFQGSIAPTRGSIPIA